MSLPELTNFQIEAGNDDDESFGGCFSRDDLPSPLQDKYYIVNLDSKTGPGSHWVLLDNRRPDQCIYIDSYGQPPPELVAKAMQATGKSDLFYNDADVQALGSQCCGWWSEYFSEELEHEPDVRKVVSFAQHQKDPDAYLSTIYTPPKPGQPFEFNKTEFLKSHLSSGTGLFDVIKNRIHFKPRQHATKRFAEFLQREGNKEIKQIQVGRTPVVGGVQKALNVLSLGGYDRAKKKLKYDDVYHNFLVVTLSDGSRYRIEKNHVVEAKPYKPSKKKGFEPMLHDLPVTSGLQLQSLIQKAEDNNSKFWRYDPATNNCQVFVNEIVKKNNLEPTDEETAKILKPQEGKTLIQSLPTPLQAVPKLVTDIAAVGDRVIHGDGVKGGRKRKRVEGGWAGGFRAGYVISPRSQARKDAFIQTGKWQGDW